MKRWVLFVEDDADDRDLMLWALQTHKLDVEIRYAVDGLDAQRKLESLKEGARPAMIITDLKLPKINGIELLQWMTGRPELAAVPKVVVTSSGEHRDEETCRALGAVEYLTKPMTLDGYGRLVEILRRRLG